ncbi:hypothetical protein V2I01_34350 [Micromonospora sp. BRA006-A]|nr:hypothetical protein [Micromonospora sp. BRA006-A]
MPVLLLAGCSGPATVPAGAPATSGPAATGPAVPAACAERLETGRLPDWADAGFTGDTRVRHVSAPGATSWRSCSRTRWCTRAATARTTRSSGWRPAGPEPAPRTPLVITATRDGTDTPVVREVAGGPGPSIVDLPAAGCWRLRLDWSGRTDTMDLVYRPASG